MGDLRRLVENGGRSRRLPHRPSDCPKRFNVHGSPFPLCFLSRTDVRYFVGVLRRSSSLARTKALKPAPALSSFICSWRSFLRSWRHRAIDPFRNVEPNTRRVSRPNKQSCTPSPCPRAGDIKSVRSPSESVLRLLSSSVLQNMHLRQILKIPCSLQRHHRVSTSTFLSRPTPVLGANRRVAPLLANREPTGLDAVNPNQPSPVSNQPHTPHKKNNPTSAQPRRPCVYTLFTSTRLTLPTRALEKSSARGWCSRTRPIAQHQE